MSEASPVLDRRRFALLRVTGEGEPDAELASLVRAFLDSSRATLQELRAADRAGDRHQIAALAHRLKGSSVLFGAMRLRDAGGVLQEAARREVRAPDAELAAALAAVERELAAAADAFERELRAQG